MAQTTKQPPKKRSDEILFPPLIPAPVPVYGGPGLPPAPVGGGPLMLPSIGGGPQTGPIFNMGGPQPTPAPMVGGAPVRPALPPGNAPPGRVFNMGGPRPAPQGALPPGMGGPRLLGSGAGGAAAASRFVLPSMGTLAAGAGVLGGGVLAANGAMEAADDPTSRLGRRITQASTEMQLARQQGASTGRKAGIAVRNAAAGAGEAVLAGAKALIPTEFFSGLFGIDTPAAPAAPAVPAAPLFNDFQQAIFDSRARARVASSPAAAAAPEGEMLTYNQLIPLLNAMPQLSRGGGQGVRGEDLLYDRLNKMYDMREQAIMALPESDERKSRLMDALQRELAATLTKQLYMPDTEME